MSDIELLQFRYSPYNEKVRWALDLKRVPHRRRSLLPGPHMRTVRRLTGQTQTPVLKLDGEWLAGSARIVEALERAFPAPALFPDDAAERAAACEIASRFDDDFGPDVRRAGLGRTLEHIGYLAGMFAEARSPAARLAYRCTLPLAAPLIRRGNGIAGPEDVARGERAVAAALDFVAERSRATGYLQGARFSVADLTAASVLAPVINPPDSPMQRPAPVPPVLADWLAGWREHPGSEWVLSMYARHRGASSDAEGAVSYPD